VGWIRRARTPPRRGRLHLITFAGTLDPHDDEWERRQEVLHRSALRHGFDSGVPWTREQLVTTSFYEQHRDVLDRVRGAGSWAWKPYVIQQALDSVDEGDHVVYWDVGRAHRGNPRVGNRIRRRLDPLLHWCDEVGGGALPGTLVPQHGPNRCWTKRDCFVLMDCDESRYWEAPQVEATFSIWRCEDRSRAFVDAWLAYAVDARVITDDDNTCGLPNLQGFRDHRHDQSILTNLVLREGLRAPPCCRGGSKDINRLAEQIRTLEPPARGTRP